MSGKGKNAFYGLKGVPHPQWLSFRSASTLDFKLPTKEPKIDGMSCCLVMPRETTKNPP